MNFSSFSSSLRIAAFVLAAVLALGCSSSDDDKSSNDDAAATGTPGEQFQCSSDPRVETYVANLEKKGVLGRAAFVITSADPAPPRRGLNAWTLHVMENGAPIAGAELTVSGMMPDHQHGWSTAPTITKGGDGMTFTIEKMNLMMGGVWTVTFEAQTKGSDGSATTVDRATFTFCIG